MNRKLPAVVEKTFVFRNNSEELYPLLKDILTFIQATVSEEANERIGGKCKLILIELFTNSLKHSDVQESLFSFEIDEEGVNIIKSDSGKPFNLPSLQFAEVISIPVADKWLNEKLIVYRDDMASLYCVPEGQYKLSFIVRDFDVDVPPVPANLLEHFGLMIIAKAADRFTYEFDPELRANIFKASISF